MNYHAKDTSGPGTDDISNKSLETHKTRSVSRRRVLEAGAATGVTAIAGCGEFGGAGGTEELVISSYGGAFDDLMEEVSEEFESENDVDTSLVPYTTVAEFEAMSDDPDVDVALLDDFDVIAGGTDLFVELDPDIVTRYDQQFESAYLPGDPGISHIFSAYALAYDTDQWAASDFESWGNLWDEQFAGELAIQNDWPPFMMAAAQAFDADERNMEPFWEQLPALSDNVEVFYEGFADPEQLFEQDQISVASWFDGRTFALRDAGEPVAFTIPEEGATQIRGAVAAVQNSGVEETAQEFINHLLAPDVQERFAENLFYGPTNPETEVPSAVADDVITEGDLDDLIVPDWEYINENRESFTNNWQDNI